MTDEPLLGLASTEELLREVITRLADHSMGTAWALAMAEMLGAMTAAQREYRTVDRSEDVAQSPHTARRSDRR